MSRKYTCNSRYFKRIDTEQKAYWLGFIAADGYLVQKGTTPALLGICLGLADKAHLEAFKTAISATNPIECREDTVQYAQYDHTTVLKSVKIRINDRQLVADLNRLGIQPRKSLTTAFPDSTQVPPHLLRHFIRGYFDGDGSIWKSQTGKYAKWGFNVLAPDDFCVKLYAVLCQDVLPSTAFTFVPHPKTEGMTYLSVFALKHMRDIRDYFYKDATIYLVRKRDKFNQLPAKVEADRDVCRRELPLILAGCQEELSTGQLVSEMEKVIPAVKPLTVGITLKELADDGIITFTRRVEGIKHYIYEF